MRAYTVTVSYTLGGTTQPNFVVRRRAATSASAIASVTALFTGLSNYYGTDGRNYLNVLSVVALELVETTSGNNSTNNENETEGE